MAVTQKLDGDITRLFNDFTISAAFLLADAAIIRQWFVTKKEEKENNNEKTNHEDDGDTGGEGGTCLSNTNESRDLRKDLLDQMRIAPPYGKTQRPL